MATMLINILLSKCIIAIFFFGICSDAHTDGRTGSYGRPCTYFGGDRVTKARDSLVNCSWYSSNACCMRTEVTSVFGSMYPLYGATKMCSNQLNYLMCYFCSPEQYIWYNHGKAMICQEFCDSVFDHCKFAKYNGVAIGEKYKSGADFCRGQKFDVRESDCFEFDPEVFGRSHIYTGSFLLMSLTFILAVWLS